MTESVEEFAHRASLWLAENGKLLNEDNSFPPSIDGPEWGEGNFNVAVFHDLSFDDERALLADAQRWQMLKATRGYHAITESPSVGGLGLTQEHARAFTELERGYRVPAGHESFSVTTDLISPTVAVFATSERHAQFVGDFLAAKTLCCQLFSEPGAGSDLASLACRAQRSDQHDGDEWIINGQKVWSSGAQFSEWGLLIARSDPTAPKHKGMTAFLIPMQVAGVEVRPIRQMSGGSSFNEVFFQDCRIPDTMRLGGVGEGWKVALTTLGFERDHSDPTGAAGGDRPGGRWPQLLATARAMGVTNDAVCRQELMDVFIHKRVEALLNQRAADLARGGIPGPEGSLGKLMWTEGMTKMSRVASSILGPSLTANTGVWGTWEWGEHLLGAPGYRIAGGSDEVQRNIIGERVLGLAPEPRPDKATPWAELPR